MTQRTLVLLKPDAVRRGLTGEIISRIERKAGWRITALELRTLDTGHAGAALTASTRASRSTSRWWSSWRPGRSWR
ncbi:Nucleoside diphosphate kinase [Streptomyces griseomycini]